MISGLTRHHLDWKLHNLLYIYIYILIIYIIIHALYQLLSSIIQLETPVPLFTISPHPPLPSPNFHLSLFIPRTLLVVFLLCNSSDECQSCHNLVIFAMTWAFDGLIGSYLANTDRTHGLKDSFDPFMRKPTNGFGPYSLYLLLRFCNNGHK